jgi:hypothetical protein
MNDVEPCFFLSYSQADNDGGYLHNFFELLRIRVSQRARLAINPNEQGAEEKLNKVGFCDRYGVKAAQDWMEKIATALRRNGVLVCAYSPNFFSKVQTKQFCGREVRAFLMRDERIKFPQSKEAWDDFQINGDCRILPVVWDSLDEDLPPRALRAVTWSLDKEKISEDINTSYLKKGMRHIVRATGLPREGAAYDEILTYLANRIVAIMKEPLAPLDTELNFDDLRNAF